MTTFAQSTKIEYTVHPSRSSVKWTGNYLFNFGEHTGTVDVSSGRLTVTGGLVAGFVIVEMKTIKSLDLPPDDGGKSLAEHLMSKDFFDVSAFPQARIDIVNTEPIADAANGEPNTKVTANLTIKGVSRPITFLATITSSQKEIKTTGRLKFDRTRWGIVYDSGKVFSEIGDGAISDAISIEFTLIAEQP